MRILLDHMVPHGLRDAFGEHEVVTVAYRGWADLTNGELLDAAQQEFDALVTVDRSMDQQQATDDYDLAIVVLVTHPATEENLRELLSQRRGQLDHVRPRRVYRFKR